MMTDYKFRKNQRVKNFQCGDVIFRVIGRHHGQRANIYEVQAEDDGLRRGVCYEDDLEAVQ